MTSDEVKKLGASRERDYQVIIDRMWEALELAREEMLTFRDFAVRGNVHVYGRAESKEFQDALDAVDDAIEIAKRKR